MENPDENKLLAQMIEKNEMFDVVVNGKLDELRCLVQRGASLEHRDDMSRHSLLTAAVFYNRIEAIKILVKGGADVNGEDLAGNTPLVWASGSNGSMERVQCLIDLGADINHAYNGFTALRAAAMTGQADIVKLLLEKGADATVKYTDGKTALDMAVQGNKADVIAVFEGFAIKSKHTAAAERRAALKKSAPRLKFS